MSTAAKPGQPAIMLVSLICAGLLVFTANFYRQLERQQEQLAAQAMRLAEGLAVQLGEEQPRLVNQ